MKTKTRRPLNTKIHGRSYGERKKKKKKSRTQKPYGVHRDGSVRNTEEVFVLYALSLVAEDGMGGEGGRMWTEHFFFEKPSKKWRSNDKIVAGITQPTTHRKR